MKVEIYQSGGAPDHSLDANAQKEPVDPSVNTSDPLARDVLAAANLTDGLTERLAMSGGASGGGGGTPTWSAD